MLSDQLISKRKAFLSSFSLGTPHQVMSCYVTICYVMLCYVMLCYVMLCYDML